MALHLNLFHEIQKAKQLQRRDPLKLSIFGLIAVASGFALYYFVELGRAHAINQELQQAQAEYQALEPKAKAAKLKEEELNGEIIKADRLIGRIEKRFYWGPILDELSRVVPREVQITRFTGGVAGDSPRTCSLVLDGLSAGEDPRRVAEELRTAIAERFGSKFKTVTSNFKSLEDGTELVMLESKQLATATFAINVQLITHDDAPAVPATTRKKR
ncbi:MAG TPA: hypothetical protein VF593_10845 [Chthoniobacteraceae bacterium]|jgi:hypothetical protein